MKYMMINSTNIILCYAMMYQFMVAIFWHLFNSAGNSYVMREVILYMARIFCIWCVYAVLFYEMPFMAEMPVASVWFFENNYFLAVMKLFIYVFCCFLLFLPAYYTYQFILLFYFSMFGLICFMCSINLMSMYISLEMSTLSSLALVFGGSRLMTEASLSYYMYSSFMGTFFLMGSSLLYFSYGTLDLIELHELMSIEMKDVYVIFGVLFLLTSLLFKIGLGAFCIWLVQMYSSSSFIVMSFLVNCFKLGLVVVFMKMWYLLFLGKDLMFMVYVVLSALVSLVMGCYSNYVCFSLKEFVAWSSVVNSSFLYCVMVLDTDISLVACVTYLIYYSMVNLFLFGLFSFYMESTSVSDMYLYELEQYMFSYANMMLFVMLILNVAGLPPFMGFFIKLNLIFSLYFFGAKVLTMMFLVFFVLTGFVYFSFMSYFFLASNSSFFSKKGHVKYKMDNMLMALTISMWMVVGCVFFFWSMTILEDFIYDMVKSMMMNYVQ